MGRFVIRMLRRPSIVIRTLLAALLVAGLSGCSLLHPIHVTTGYDHSAPIAQRSWSWAQVKMAVPVYEAPVKAAITKELANRGWQYTPSGGSATVFVWGNIQGQAQLDRDYAQYGPEWVQPWGLHGLGPGWARDSYGEDTHIALGLPGNNLVVDVFDSRTHRLLVRGVGEDDLAATQEKNTKRLERVIHAMLGKLPKH